jgi:hypothetical protein
MNPLLSATFAPIFVQDVPEIGSCITGVGVGEGVAVGVGEGVAVGVGEGVAVGVGEGVAVGVGEGVAVGVGEGVGVAFLIMTPLSQTNFLPFLIQV